MSGHPFCIAKGRKDASDVQKKKIEKKNFSNYMGNQAENFVIIGCTLNRTLQIIKCTITYC